MTPIDILTKKLEEIREKIADEHNCIETHDTQAYEAKLRLQQHEAEKIDFENTIMELKKCKT